MRLLSYVSAWLLCLGVAQAATTAPTPPAITRLDHILLWGRGIDQVTSVMSVKLGFQVRPGRDPGGVANRYIRFSDSSFIELLGITRPDPTFDPGMKQDQQALKGGPGSRTFGFRTSSLDTLHQALQGLHYAVTPFFSGPDSAKPGWRLFAFDRAPLSSNTFFIDYAADYAPDQFEPGNADDYRVTREHPNGARELSSIWLVSGDAEADRRELEKMGFGHAVPVKLPALGAKGFCVPVGPTALLALQPDGTGIAQQVMASGGPRILGLSLGVADLGRAQRWVERGYERALTTYPGLSGESFLAPTQDDLGLSIEFHAIRQGGSPCSSAAP
ncbi:Glyoxalase-like domain-containing protein [Dyella jiangningensis]|uniref:VOC family protein n=1 Tax=Dyella sp. AtDHG13 TaxID=1938897 RepID=UPI00088EBB1D|nr:VOC family protein [Dyella sp. AtDHG13]PXV56053.1 glyoxalase-like protein [Dyella sp. AtDHG13]SDK69927.1 Glyoxalase-like domain-containing protein [Dyella jiangningensis]